LTTGLKGRIVKLAILMTKLLRVSLCAAFVVGALAAGSRTSAASSLRDTGSLSGTAMKSSGQGMADVNVQIRDLSTGRLAGTTTTTATGAFSFGDVPAGQYVAEIVNAAGQIVGTSAAIVVSANSPVTGVSVMEGREQDPVGAAAAGASAGGHGKTIAIITSIAAAAAVVTAVTVAGSASPSR
jgi:Carboxypeptidase regulatory-like domain